ncbi:MAG: hypothetical protein AB1497_03255 [Bacillota bacterium]
MVFLGRPCWPIWRSGGRVLGPSGGEHLLVTSFKCLVAGTLTGLLHHLPDLNEEIDHLLGPALALFGEGSELPEVVGALECVVDFGVGEVRGRGIVDSRAN